MIGISAYAGLEIDIEEILKYIEEAHHMGIDLLFTSAHIPEVGESFEDDFERILNLCNELGITTIVDISKDYFESLDLNRYKIDYIRLDFGFTLEEAALMTKEQGYGISVNATTFDEEQIEEFIKYGGRLDKINACHNFYPRRDTGISEELFIEKNRIFKEYGIKTMAFIPTNYKRRGPVYEGLPTLEEHRDMNPIVSAQHLLMLGVDFIVVGDAMASIDELQVLSSIEEDVTLLPVELKDNISEVELSLLRQVHTNRVDPGEYAIRSQESRLIKEGIIPPNNNNIMRKKYSITIDNEGYNRYEGELQILKKDLNADPRVNIVADGYEARILIELLQPGEKFKFYF
ncbi:MupG family TIM beta-alpha barrel fold protein [Clostridium sp. Cult3]|uniref:MupG family TIM beta-alpha barrel fold protein n=1 Tax=Clostridium sp. Cult3 TaxID=2079004 RepID=UPI001F475E1D|nr:MupG family TIM beta-alpha barrel fold protein [Clostridium sp. Cult3]MCF6459853.1 DUF871 domain-containing protein [Clostridium sp. Cult3]